MTPPTKCAACKWWTLPVEGVGDCVRHPPVVILNGDRDIESWWPETEYDDFCGEAEAGKVNP
jgi:hypothetical protein